VCNQWKSREGRVTWLCNRAEKTSLVSAYITGWRSIIADEADRQELHCRRPTLSTPIKQPVVAVPTWWQMNECCKLRVGRRNSWIQFFLQRDLDIIVCQDHEQRRLVQSRLWRLKLVSLEIGVGDEIMKANVPPSMWDSADVYCLTSTTWCHYCTSTDNTATRPLRSV